VHLIAKSKGFWDGDVNYDKIGNKLALVHSEVTEVLEAIRKDQGSEKTVEEVADVIIRLVDVYQAMINTGQIKHSLDDVLERKILKNMERPALHGNKF
jgi:NTP pyrophosphatase (non-canonical NTP hydrolase)